VNVGEGGRGGKTDGAEKCEEQEGQGFVHGVADSIQYEVSKEWGLAEKSASISEVKGGSLPPLRLLIALIYLLMHNTKIFNVKSLWLQLLGTGHQRIFS
jgi:hypothetical protein